MDGFSGHGLAPRAAQNTLRMRSQGVQAGILPLRLIVGRDDLFQALQLLLSSRDLFGKRAAVLIPARASALVKPISQWRITQSLQGTGRTERQKRRQPLLRMAPGPQARKKDWR